MNEVLKELESQINSYITNPGSRLLVILDNDSGIARETVIQCCQANGLVLTRDTHYSPNLPIPTEMIRYPNEADVLLEYWASPLSDLENYDGVIEKAMQFKDSYTKSVIIIGGFVIPNDSIWKDSDRIILFDANSFDFWLNWAMSKKQNGRQNIHPKITAFLKQHPEWLEPKHVKGQICFPTRFTWSSLSDEIYNMIERKLKYKYPDQYVNNKGGILDDEAKENFKYLLAHGKIPQQWNSLDPDDSDDLEDIAAKNVGVHAAAALKAFLCGKEVDYPI